MPTDPMQVGTSGQRPRCKATNRSGTRCTSYPIYGSTVCRMHGGAAPQVKRKASLRLLELIDPAIATLAREMTGADKSADRQRAANSILDRAGMPRRVETTDPEAAKALLVERLLALRDRPGAEPEVHDIIEGSLLPDINPPDLTEETPTA